MRAIQLSVGGRAITPSDGSSRGYLDAGDRYDPDGLRPVPDLYAIEDGRVVTGGIGTFVDTLGPLGSGDYDIRSLGVSVSASHVAAVSADGTELYVAPGEGLDARSPDRSRVRSTWLLPAGTTATASGCSTAAPAGRGWWSSSTAWRRRSVPGLTGRTVTRLLVSRDGSRLVAVVRGRKTDRVVSTRVLHDTAGGILGFTPLQVLPVPAEGSPRIRDIGWRTPTSISVLRNLNDELSLVRTVSVDGAPGDVETVGSTIVRGRMRSLVSAPVVTSEAFALGRGILGERDPPRAHPAGPARGAVLAHLRRLIHRSLAPGCRRTSAGAGMGRVLDEALDLFLGSRCVGCDAPDGCCAPAAAPRSRPGRASPGPARSRTGSWCPGRPRRTTARSARSWWVTRTAASGGTVGCSATCWRRRAQRHGTPRPRRAPAARARAVASGSRAAAGLRGDRRARADRGGTRTPRATGGRGTPARLARSRGPGGPRRARAGDQHEPLDALSLDGAGAAARRWPTARVVVCDDVVTTGSTAREAQRALEAVGLPPVAIAAVAATRRRGGGGRGGSRWLAAEPRGASVLSWSPPGSVVASWG